MASKGKAPLPLRSRPPPDPPPFAILPTPLKSLTLTEPPDPPDPPDATSTLVFIPFVSDSHSPSPQTVTQVIDLEPEPPASAMAFVSKSGVVPGVSTGRELSSTVRSTLLPCTCVSELSLQSAYVEVSIFRIFGLVSLGHVSCSDLINLVFVMALRAEELEYPPERYLLNSAIRAWSVSLQEIGADMSVLIQLLAVLKPSSLRCTTLQSFEDWTLDVETLVVDCFVAVVLLNVYNSCISPYSFRLRGSHSPKLNFSVRLRGSPSPKPVSSQGKAKEARKVLSLHQDRVRQAPRSLSNAAWSNDKLTAGLGWVFSGSGLETLIRGSTVEIFISSSLIAEATTIPVNELGRT